MRVRVAAIALTTALLSLTMAMPAMAAQGAVPASDPAQQAKRAEETLTAVLSLVDSVHVAADKTVITVGSAADARDITVDYNELSQNRSVRGIGLLVGVFIGIEMLGRVTRTLRAFRGLGGR